jgi:peptidoglycan/xylan/chitin deacetylase (PgdA/CDA1 family)
MRRNRVTRFLVVCFAVGALVGLMSGLAFGGPSDGGTTRANSAAATTEATSPSASSEDSTDATTVSQPMTPERAKAIGANELGQVMVLMYHHIDSKETEWTRTPENFRKDIALLKTEGFYPVNVRDLASGNIDIPAGKSPVVITFDDSSPGQYRILDDGSIDPDCAIGIMQAAVKEGGWASRASFYCLLDVVPKERVIFGQPDRQQEKLRNLVNWGYEVGSHTVTHLNLKKASKNEIIKQLAQSQQTLEDLIGGGYAVTSIAIPFGEYPADVSIIGSGEYEGVAYRYTAALALGVEPSASPFSTSFNAMRIPRIRGSENLIVEAIQNFKNHPELRYISDGDPTTVSAPAELASALGSLAKDLGRPVIRY